MFISKKKYIEAITKNDEWYKEQIKSLKKELEEAKDLKAILNKLYPLNELATNGYVVSSMGGGYELNLPDNVLVYVDDILGGKAIKQEGNKCIVIDAEGNVKTGITKENKDKGYNYKLIRE